MIMKCMNIMMHFHIQTISSYDSFKDITKQNEIGIKSVHITAFDYEMHEYLDAFSYSNNYSALNDLILILSPVISV